ncbi:MAG: Hsp20/alpha crystallin family protein [Promethearchaeia archaeon]
MIIDLFLVGNMLEVRGQKKTFDYQKGLGGFIRKEFRGPKNIDKDEIEAKMKHGILTLTIPIKKRKSKKKVSILTFL